MNEEVENKTDIEENAVRKGNSILRVFLRIFLVLIVGCLIGAVVYFSSAGWVPYLTQRYADPIQSNQNQIQEIAATQQAFNDQLGTLLGTLQDSQSSRDPDLQSTLLAADLALDDVLTAMETVQAYSYTQIPSLLAALTRDLQSNQRNLSALATAQMAYRGSQFESEFIKILALLSRANQYLLHNNFGLAEDQLTTAQQILLDSEKTLPSWQREQALELASLIDGAITDLPDQPEVAILKLELAWQVALESLSDLSIQDLQATPSPTGEGSFTPTTTP